MPWELTGNPNTDPNVNFVGTTDQQPLSIRTNGNEAVSIDTSGNVGIGTASPEYQLHVGPGSSSIDPSRVNAVVASNNPGAGIAIAQNNGVNVLLQTSTASGFLGTTSNHPLVLTTNDRNRIIIDVNGNVGIGTASPENLLQVGVGSSSIDPGRINAVVASSINPDAGIAIAQNSGENVLLQASTAGGFLGTTSDHLVSLRTNDQDRMVIDANGNSTFNGSVTVTSDAGDAVVGNSGSGRGVVGNGFTATGIGVLGQNGAGDAVFGNSGSGRGVVGHSTNQAGVVGDSDQFDGVFGVTRNPKPAEPEPKS